MNNIKYSSENKKNSKIGFVYLLLSIIVILLGTSGYFYYQYYKLSKSPIAAQIAAQEEVKRLTLSIGKLMLLPKNETPSIATITDISKLKDKIFFKNAANGNKVLIYPNSKQAILYDPKANLIINVGPVNFSQQQTQQVQKTHIGLRNGTNVVGLTNKIEADIKKSFTEVDVTLKEQDKRTDYKKTIVVVLNDVSINIAEKIAKNLNSQVDKLPKGETEPTNVDILVIVGEDKI